MASDSRPAKTNNRHFLDEYSVGDTLIGKGGSGKVVEGVHLLSGTLVAIKVINPLQRPNAERARKLFVREVKLHAVVSGLPGVVRLLGASPPTSESSCYLATELATMGDLFVLLKKRKALTEKHVREVVMQLVTAVVGLHRNNICHRDIKPENVLLERSGTDSPGLIFKLADFGHAGLMPSDNTRLCTRDCGTPGYKAPELRDDWKHGHGLEADLWSVGAVMNDCFSFKSRQLPVSDAAFWNREVWETVSTNARNLLSRFLDPNPCKRITGEEALRHPWLAGEKSETVSRGLRVSESATPSTSTTIIIKSTKNQGNKSTNPKSGNDGAHGGTRTNIPFKSIKTERGEGLKPHSGGIINGANTKDTATAATTTATTADNEGLGQGGDTGFKPHGSGKTKSDGFGKDSSRFQHAHTGVKNSNNNHNDGSGKDGFQPHNLGCAENVSHRIHSDAARRLKRHIRAGGSDRDSADKRGAKDKDATKKNKDNHGDQEGGGNVSGIKLPTLLPPSVSSSSSPCCTKYPAPTAISDICQGLKVNLLHRSCAGNKTPFSTGEDIKTAAAVSAAAAAEHATYTPAPLGI